MTDDTTRPRRKKRPKVQWQMHPKIVALAVVAVLTLVLAGLMFTLSFDSLRALAIEMGARAERAWMAPVAIDIAQAAATAVLVVLGPRKKRITWSRAYCWLLATVTVMLSVAGNSYHAYQLAQRNAARVAAGEDIGFIPQPPVIAAVIAAIWPLLYLALLHLITIMIRVIADERAHRTIPASVPATATVQVTARNHADSAPAVQRATAPRRNHLAPVATAATAATETAPAPRSDDDAHPTAVVDAPDADAATETGAPAPVDAPATETVHPVDAPAPRPMPADAPATRTGLPQTATGLHRFIATVDLSDAVKEVALIRIDEPNLNQVQIAARLHVDKSTVSRRWARFVRAAEAEGFTVPPLPAEMAVDTASDRELQPA